MLSSKAAQCTVISITFSLFSNVSSALNSTGNGTSSEEEVVGSQYDDQHVGDQHGDDQHVCDQHGDDRHVGYHHDLIVQHGCLSP